MNAAAERSVLAPLIDVGLTKAEIRLVARAYGLSVWDKPASACLASRFPTGTPVTVKGLEQVERCETLLLKLGFQKVRARYHHQMVRVELDQAGLARVQNEPALKQAVVESGMDAGFLRVEIDPRGYRSGSVHTPLLVTIAGE